MNLQQKRLKLRIQITVQLKQNKTNRNSEVTIHSYFPSNGIAVAMVILPRDKP